MFENPATIVVLQPCLGPLDFMVTDDKFSNSPLFSHNGNQYPFVSMNQYCETEFQQTTYCIQDISLQWTFQHVKYFKRGG